MARKGRNDTEERSGGPERTQDECTADWDEVSAAMQMGVQVTTASSRSLKISRALAVGAEASCAAWDRKPMRGLGSKTLSQEAVKVTATSHTSGPRVTPA